MKHQLDFEKPIVELEHKLEELKKHPETHSLEISFENEVALIEKKIEETKKEKSTQNTHKEKELDTQQKNKTQNNNNHQEHHISEKEKVTHHIIKRSEKGETPSTDQKAVGKEELSPSSQKNINQNKSHSLSSRTHTKPVVPETFTHTHPPGKIVTNTHKNTKHKKHKTQKTHKNNNTKTIKHKNYKTNHPHKNNNTKTQTTHTQTTPHNIQLHTIQSPHQPTQI